MYTNDDVMTIEHELAHSRSTTNTVEMTYNDMYVTDIVINPSEKMNLRLVNIEIRCADVEEANFARDTLVSSTASEYDSHVRDNVLCVGLCFESDVFHTPKTPVPLIFCDRNVEVIRQKALDVGGFELPLNFEIGRYKDDVVTVSETENGAGLKINDETMPHIQLDYETRYIFKGPGIQQFDVDARYLTEKGYVLKEDFYMKNRINTSTSSFIRRTTRRTRIERTGFRMIFSLYLNVQVSPGRRVTHGKDVHRIGKKVSEIRHRERNAE